MARAVAVRDSAVNGKAILLKPGKRKIPTSGRRHDLGGVHDAGLQFVVEPIAVPAEVEGRSKMAVAITSSPNPSPRLATPWLLLLTAPDARHLSLPRVRRESPDPWSAGHLRGEGVARRRSLTRDAPIDYVRV